MENVSLDNIHLTFGGGGTAEDGARRELPEIAGEYFMMGPMPAYGLYAQWVRGLTMQNIRFQVTTPDLRPAVIFDQVTDATIQNLSIEGNPAAESTLRFTASKQSCSPHRGSSLRRQPSSNSKARATIVSSSMAATSQTQRLPCPSKTVPATRPSNCDNSRSKTAYEMPFREDQRG